MEKRLLFGISCGISLGGFCGALFTQEEFRFGQDMEILSSSLSYSSTTQRWADEKIARREAPQIFINFANYLKVSLSTSNNRCNFSDIGIRQVSDTVAQQIQEACKIGIFNGTNGKFYPNADFTNAEAITSVIRVLDGTQRETNVVHWSEPYYTLAKKRDLLENSTLLRKFTPITRGNLLSLLLLTSEKYAKTSRSLSENLTSSWDIACSAGIETLKQTARQVYTWDKLTDALAKLDAKCS